MKISYRREMKHNYLVIEPEELDWQHYEYQMMLENNIEGLLTFSMQQTNDQIRFFYEITSRQPLSRLLEGTPVRSGEIRKLVTGISGALGDIEKYLLSENSMLLNPDYLYVDPESFRIWICLVPGLRQNFAEDFSKLMEYLLGKVDHQDKESVVLAYGLYQETRKPNYGMEDILKLLYQQQEIPKAEAEVYDEGEPELPLRQLYSPPPSRPSSKDFLQTVKTVLGKRKKPEPIQTGQIPWEMMFEEEPERTPVETAPVGQDTQLLADFTGKEKIQWLRALDEGEADIPISYYPFIIGKQQNIVDYYLDRDTVSRLHLRIDRDNNGYRVTDLNSTNGTIIGGKTLENNETMELQSGDVVCISRYRYQFDK